MSVSGPPAAAGHEGAAGSFGWHQRATFAALLVGYMGYYLCRQNFAAAFEPMRTSLGFDETDFGRISSAGTLLYALGKLSTGAAADALGGRRIFLVGLWGSVAATVLFGAGSGVGFFLGAWCLNRFFQSMGWGGLVSVLSRWFPRSQYGTAMGFMTISYQFGGAVATLFAGALIHAGVGWRGLFFAPAAALAVIGVAAHVLVKGSPRDVGYALPEDGTAPTPAPAADDGDRDSLGARLASVLLQPAFLLMCLLSAILTFLRECFSLWMPAYFSTMGAEASVAVFKSAVFPLLGCVGTLAAGFVTDRYLRGSRLPVIAGSIALLAVSLLGLAYLTPLAGAAGVPRDWLAVALVGTTGFFLLAPYSMVGGGVVALDFGGRKTAGTAAGLLDGFGYLAGVAAGIGVAEVVKRAGWERAYLSMAVITAVGVGICGGLWRLQRRQA